MLKDHVMIDRINRTVKAYLNTNNLGNYSPARFEDILHNEVLGIFGELMFDVNRFVNRQNRGLAGSGLENTPDKVREKILHYLMPDTDLTYSGNTFVLPSDLKFFDMVLYSGIPVEMCKSSREFTAVSTSDPDETYPIGLKIGSNIKIAPSTIISGVTVSYLRNPIRAKWTYIIVNGTEIFNPSAEDFQDVDIHPSDEYELIRRVLQGFGVSLKEPDVIRMVQEEKAREFNQENTN